MSSGAPLSPGGELSSRAALSSSPEPESGGTEPVSSLSIRPCLEQLVKGLTPEALTAKGVQKARVATLARSGPHLYVQAEQVGEQGESAKYMLAFQQNDVASLVTVNVRKSELEAGSVVAADIERILASASVAPYPAPAREVFALDYMGPFKAAGTMLGTTRVFTLDGRMEPSKKGEVRPVLIVSPSLDRRLLPEPVAYAEKLLEGLPGIAAPSITERRRITIAGLDAVELVGKATDKDGKAEIALYQVMLLGPEGGYYRIVGQMPFAERDRLLPELRRIAAGFRRVN